MNPFLKVSLKTGLSCTIGLICCFAAMGNGYAKNRPTATLLWILGGGFFSYGIYALVFEFPDGQQHEISQEGYNNSANYYTNSFNSNVAVPQPSQPVQPAVTRHANPQPAQPPLAYPTPQPIPTSPYPHPRREAVAASEAPISNSDPRILFYQIVLRIHGMQQGSGKTSLLDRVIAEHLIRGHRVEFINPFAPKREYKGLKVWGRGYNYNDAAKGLANFALEMNRRIRLRGMYEDYDPLENEVKYFMAIDELSGYAQQIPEAIMLPEFFAPEELDHLLEGKTPSEKSATLAKPFEPLTEFFAAIVDRPRQANGAVALASHGETQRLNGGSKALAGLSDNMNSSFRVYRYARVDPSNKSGFSPEPYAEFCPPHQAEKIRVLLDHTWQAPNPEKDFSHLIPQPPTEEIEQSTALEEEPDDNLWETTEAINLDNLLPFPTQNPEHFNLS